MLQTEGLSGLLIRGTGVARGRGLMTTNYGNNNTIANNQILVKTESDCLNYIASRTRTLVMCVIIMMSSLCARDIMYKSVHSV